ncbi:MAG: CBS domain-containing protein [Spirochaetia bacterium]|nr:CBS domain-containing protein [Spirochaetia bacterium]
MNTVKNILDKKGYEVVSVKPEDLLSQALLKLTQYKIGAIMVLDDNKAIKGILSERDIVRHLAGRIDCTTALPVSDVMTKSVTYVKPHQSLDDCLQLMTTGRFRHLPVVDNDELVGIISIGDVTKYQLAEHALKIGQLEYYITNTY